MKKPLVILIGPSGVGKSSFLERAQRDFAALKDIITYTTRAMRQGEVEGNPYHFVSRAKFEELIGKSFFVEYAEVHGNLYGTPYSEIEQAWQQGQAVIMDLDVQGAKTFMAKFPHALTIFILPPSMDSLRQRVIKREGRPPVDLDLRMKNAEDEIAQSALFSHRLVNDDFELAYSQLKKLIEDLLQSR